MKPTKVLLHHVGFNHSFYSVNSYHRKKYRMKSKSGWYVCYNYFIDNSGKIFKAREEGEEGCHTKGYNNDVAICLRGNLEEKKPTAQQLNALRELLKDIQKRWGIPNKEIYAHRELSNTLCPGKYLMPFIDNYRKYITEPTPTTNDAPKDAVEPTVAVVAPTRSSLQRQIDRIKVLLINLRRKIYELLSKKRIS